MGVRKLELYLDEMCVRVGGVSVAFTDTEDVTCSAWFSGLPESIDDFTLRDLNDQFPNVRSSEDFEFMLGAYNQAMLQCEQVGSATVLVGNYILLEESKWII